jgi:hypothetical protein
MVPVIPPMVVTGVGTGAKVSVSLDEAVVAFLDEYAHARGIPARSAFARRAVEKTLAPGPHRIGMLTAGGRP